MADITVLQPALRASLFAMKRTARAMDVTQHRLATGRKVNSALDNPQNFFTARSLSNRSSDLRRLLDGIGQNLQVIKQTANGLEAAEAIIDQAETLVLDIQEDFPAEGILQPGEVRAGSLKALNSKILGDNPVAYWRLDETSGTTAVNLGSGGASINGTYNNGVTLGEDPIYDIFTESSVSFDGTNQYIAVPDSALINLISANERTVEITFRPNDVTSRQVLFEEGANVNDLSIYIDNGRAYVTGRDQGAWGPVDISAPIEAGKTYHIAFVYDRTSQTFSGYLNGELMGSVSIPNVAFPSHSGDIGIGAMRQNAWFHDGAGSGSNGYYYNGYMSDVAIYNTALTDQDMLDRYASVASIEVEGLNEKYNALMSQLDLLVADSGYRGTNLLTGDELLTVFNEQRSSSLTSFGDDFSAAGLNLEDRPFIDPTDLEETLTRIREARDKIRQFGTSLANDLSVIQNRETMTKAMINTLDEGSDALTLADQNEEGAKLLALQVRQQMQVSVLSFNAGFTGLF